MTNPNIKREVACFKTQGRLLQELGERLVSKTDVALLELVKNAYDADASFCHVKFDSQQMEIVDDGYGMSEEEFLNAVIYKAPVRRFPKLGRYPI